VTYIGGGVFFCAAGHRNEAHSETLLLEHTSSHRQSLDRDEWSDIVKSFELRGIIKS